MTSITTAIRADAATSDAEGRRDLAGHLADFRAALLDEAALIAAADRSRHASEVATLTATRDIVIGQRETAQRERDEARGLLHTLAADLNATREKLTAAEAHCNSFQHERDMAIANRAGLLVERDTVAAERDALRAELNRRLAIADDERAEFVLAAVAVAQALDDGRSLGPDADPYDSRPWIRFARELADRVKASRLDGRATTIAVASEQGNEIAALRAEVDKLRARPVLTVERLAEHMPGCRSCAPDHARGQIAADIMAKLGAVTLPAQDAAKAIRGILVACSARFIGRDGRVCLFPHLDGEFADQVVGMSVAALASLGAPATTPSKPADAFAGVTVEELAGIYAASFGATTAQSPARIGAISAVLAALRVKLVAPVDPLAVARMISCIGEPRPADVATVRRALEANGIPVTPEAGK